MPRRKRIFVCVQNRPVGDPRGSCHSRSGGLVYRAFFEELRKSNVSSDYQLTGTGCLGPCALGASVLVYPDDVLYGRVTPDDVAEIVARHLVAGSPVARLVVEDAPA
jgi:(2Fe-2S) ferredoxin